MVAICQVGIRVENLQRRNCKSDIQKQLGEDRNLLPGCFYYRSDLYMACENCCLSCDKDKRQCADWKERHRTVQRDIYRARKAYKAKMEAEKAGALNHEGAEG